MLGWRLLRESELALQTQLTDFRIQALTAELRAAKEYSAKCERLLDHERERIDAERERADRIADSLFQSNGLPPTSTTILNEQKAAEAVAEGKRTDYMKELMEIWSETESDMLEDGAEPVSEVIAELVK